MKCTYIFWPSILLLFTACSEVDEPILFVKKEVAEYNFTRHYRQPDRTSSQINYQLIPVYNDNEEIEAINLTTYVQACTFENGNYQCSDSTLLERNIFEYLDQNLSGFIHEPSSSGPEMTATIENNQLQSVIKRFQNEETRTDYFYQNQQVVRIEHGTNGATDKTWIKTLEYEDNNLAKLEINYIAESTREEWTFVYDSAINPFYDKTEWLLALKVGMDNWPQHSLAGEAHIFSQNNVSSISVVFTQANGDQSSATYNSNFLYDDHTYPLLNVISRSNTRSHRWIQSFSYIETE